MKTSFLIILALLLCACNPIESIKNIQDAVGLSKSSEIDNSATSTVDPISYLNGKTYENRTTNGKENTDQYIELGSGLEFPEPSKFHINAYIARGKADQGNVNVCDISGELVKINDDLLLMIGKGDDGEITTLLTTQILNENELSVKFLYPQGYPDLPCGKDAEFAVDGTYKLEK